ncbi:hypothetical protein [Halohasta litorea]|uniref:Restriction endonuclease n=1 Tax=Halohasta litorea TaxID=869891 RepID=A0ABD6DF71_9EURY|nr:hypothetical protein [Halohasta litorea]
MVHWLAVGPKFNVHSTLPYTIADWTDEYNIKDNDAVFLDLKTIYSDPTNYYTPSSGSSDTIEFPTRNAVAKHTRNGNDIFIRLPPVTDISIPKAADSEERTINLLNWLPFCIRTDSTESGKKVSVPTDHLPVRKDNASQRDWRWYFRPPQFKWQIRLMEITAWPDEQPWDSSEYELPSHHAERNESPTTGYLDKIATSNAGEPIAGKLQLQDSHEYTGDIYLLPSRQEPFSEFVIEILQQWYGYSTDVIRNDPTPLWTDNITVVGQKDIENRISEYEEQVKQLQQKVTRRTDFKRLLYDSGDKLEQTVRDAFCEFGFSVEGEEPGEWDGVIKFEDREYILEVTGTTNGISERKLSQLERHKNTYTSESTLTNNPYTLLVANIFRKNPPASREVNEGNFIETIRGTNNRVMTTKTLYCLLNAYYDGKISSDEIQRLIYESEGIVRYDQDSDLWAQSGSSTSFSNRVSTLLNKLSRGLTK